MKNIGNARLMLLLFSIILIYTCDAKELLKEFNSASLRRTEVSSSDIVLNSSRNFPTEIRKDAIRVRCRRYAQTFYKPYQRVGTYVYSPYGPYIVPPICIRCPTCCPRPCAYPSPAPIRTTYRPYRTTVRTTTTRTHPSFGTTKQGGFVFCFPWNCYINH